MVNLNIEAERAAFEAWAGIEFRNTRDFTAHEYDICWAAWQAARRAAPAVDAELPEAEIVDALNKYVLGGRKYLPAIFDIVRQYARDAIAADRQARGAELIALRAEVEEWLCIDCNTVYPGPPQAGFACVRCPKCKGTTAPRGFIERKALEKQLADLRTQLARTELQAGAVPAAWIKHLIGAECKLDGRCYDIVFCETPGYQPLYAAPAPIAQHVAQDAEGA